MRNLSHRLRKLEPAPDHQEYLRGVGQRLMRYAVETRHLVRSGKLIELAWSPGEEAIYQEWTKDPGFEADEREILANLGHGETKIER